MQIFYFKSSLALLIHSLFIIALFTPDLSFAYYRAGHHGSYGHYGYSKYGGYRYYPNKYYQRNHYRYSPYRSYQNYPRPYSTVVPTNTKVYSDSNVYQQSKANYSGVDSSGWQVLAQGQYSAALNVFAVESQSHPDSGIPKAGYALATAASGNLDRGVWAMRRAFRIDPDSLHYLQLDEKSHILVDNLIGQYASQQNDENINQGFMISALYYLKHDYIAAKKSITSAHQYGDKSSSNTNLQRLIEQHTQQVEKIN